MVSQPHHDRVYSSDCFRNCYPLKELSTTAVLFVCPLFTWKNFFNNRPESKLRTGKRLLLETSKKLSRSIAQHRFISLPVDLNALYFLSRGANKARRAAAKGNNRNEVDRLEEGVEMEKQG
jgi:hypothetical protein